MKNFNNFLIAFFLLLLGYYQTNAQGLSCQTATPLCNNITPYPINYTGTGPGTGPQAPAGSNYSCLLTTPNPTYYTLTITQSGTIQFDIQNSNIVDIDFIVYGPFPNLFAATAGCNNLGNGGAGGNVIDCSYDPQAFETVDIPNAVVGQVYILMITNFANVATNIFSTSNIGTGQIGCPCQLNANFSIVPLANGAGTLTAATNNNAEFKVCPGDTLYFNVGIGADNIADSLAIFNSLTTIGNTFNVNEYQIFGPFYPNAPFRDSMDFIVRITPGQNQNGVFTFDLGVENSGTSDCFDSYPITVVVPGIPPLPPGDTICSGGSYQANAATFPTTASGSSAYAWTQISGPAATITGANTANPTFTPPAIASGDSLSFQLVYTYGGCVQRDTIEIFGYDIDITMSATPNPVCAGQPLNLSAILTDTIGAQTTTTCAPTYSSVLIPNAPLATTGTTVTLGDDQVSAALPIGFSFQFFCNTYTQFYLGSNGFITFSPGAPGTVLNQTIPNPAAPNNLIALCWTDLDPSSGGSIRYRTIGVAPNRSLVISYTNVPTFSGGDLCTVQAILREGSNQIEMHITYAIDDIDFFVGSVEPLTIGLENANGTAILGTGINSITNSFVQNQALRITPNVITTTVFQPITYNWTPSTTLNNSTISNPVATPNAPTTYVVNIQNGACVFTDSIQVNITGALAAPVASCGSSTLNSVTINWSALAIGGSGFYQYSIDGGITWNNVGTSLTTTLSGLAPGTTVTVLVRGNNGLGTACSAGAPVTISCSTLNCLLSTTNIRQNVLCFGQSTGSIDLTPANGTAPYTYAWSNGATSQDLASLAAGTYRVTVSDVSGCSSTSSITITQPSKALGLSANIVNTSCFGGNNGCAGIDVEYGTGNYTYNWSNIGVSSDSICGLAAGTYFVTVSDAVAPSVFCTAIDTVVITQPAALSASALNTNASCNGSNNGSVNLTIAGTGYTFNWSNGATTEDISGLAVGTYNVTATSSAGCTATASATVTQPSAITSNTLTTTDATCSAGGTIDINASGGTGTLNYAWSNGANTQDVSGLSAGAYTVTISDANGCSTTNGPIAIAAIGTPSASVTVANIACNGGSNGSINLSVSGGTPNYSYSWSNGATSQDINGLAAGTYAVTVTDNLGCTATQTNLVVTQPTAVTVSNTSTNVSCNGGTNGTIPVTVSGGTSPYSYIWSNGTTTEDLNNIAAGSFSLTVTDANGCIRNLGPINITQPTALAISNVSTTIANCGQPDGTITLSVNGGTGAYTYSWSNGASAEDLTGLAAANYTITVSDANGCQTSQNIAVAGSGDISVTLTAVDEACGQPNSGALDLTVSGGNLPLTYAWSNGVTTEDIAAASAGTYNVTVTDSDGCTVTDAATVNTSFQPTLNAGVLNSLATDTLIIWGDPTLLTGGNIESGVSYAWTSVGPSNANFSAADSINTSVEPDDDGIYQFIITATSSDGCIATDTLNVEVRANTPSIPTAFSPNNDGLNDIFQVVKMDKKFIREFTIYNRWGKVVYDNADEAAWNGTFNGAEQPREVYMYTISWESSTGAGLVLKRGTITLMR